MGAELKTVLESIDTRLAAIENQIRDGFADTNTALHGIMFKLLTLSEINEIRSKMKNPPDLKGIPYWAIR